MPADFNRDDPSHQEDLRDIRIRRNSPVQGSRDAFLELRARLLDRILEGIEPDIDTAQPFQVRRYVRDRLHILLEEDGIIVNRNEKRQLLEAIVADLTDSQS